MAAERRVRNRKMAGNVMGLGRLWLAVAVAAVGVSTLAAHGQAPATQPGTGAGAAGNDIQDAQPTTPRRPQRPNYVFAPGVTIPEGPVKLDWNSVRANYKAPDWMVDGKFGIFIHWGLYSYAAHHNEWYPKHMYSNGGIIKWHAEKFGPQDVFGYKDFIPLFKVEKFNPDEWAALFKKSGAQWVIPTAEHHDHFAMWDSDITQWCAGKMGPKRDLIGDLAKAVRTQGIKYGVSNHRMYGYDFMLPAKGLKTDLFDPKYADFYGPPKEGLADQAYCNDWLARTIELIDKYQPDLLWFDWDGTGAQNPVKLQFATYYLNRANQWGKQVALSQKGDTFPVGTGVPSHEKGGRAPKEITPNFWMVDDVISDRSWGYTDDMKYRSATSIINQLADHTSKNGSLMLNISPRGDGSIPQEQQDILTAIGAWLSVNGEAIYSTRPWIQFQDAGGQARYTKKPGALYAIMNRWPKGEVALSAATEANAGKVSEVTLIGAKEPLKFTQGADGLKVTFPDQQVGQSAFVIKIKADKIK